MNKELQQYINWAKSKRNEVKRFYSKLKKKQNKNLDESFHTFHEEAFEEIDCLDCANCCKTTSPIFYDKDIDRMANFFKIKSVDFFDQYLKVDEDGDQVLKSSPCPFLLEDNKCMAYDSRPKACREYPHTNRKRMHQILELTQRNTRVCPAVASITKKMIEKTN